MKHHLQPKGTLIPIGGNEDKGTHSDEQYTLDFIEEGILSHVVRESGGKDARIVVIPTASSIPVEVGENYLDAFGRIGCRHVELLNITTREEAADTRILEQIQQANCVMFSGGDQSRITDIIEGTALHRILRKKYAEVSSFVIAGTSAGAMAMSEYMIAGGSASESFVKGAVWMYRGLGLIPNLIIDTHFIQRGRFGRIAEAIAIHPELIGVGLAEDTGLIIKGCNDITVIGSGMVIVFDGQQIDYNNQKHLELGTPMTITNLIVHVLSNGDQYDMSQRKVAVLPMEAPFL